MSTFEIAIWSAMVGGLLTLTGLACTDLYFNRKRGGVRNVVFLVVAGSACVVVSGLVERLWPALNGTTLRVLKASLGPGAGALSLNYLGLWLGSSPEDRITHGITRLGAVSMGLACIGLGVLASQTPEAMYKEVLIAAAVVTTSAALLGLIAALRASALGDPLAPWMVPTCLALVLLVLGHYAHALEIPQLGIEFSALTALLTLAYFLACTILVIVRNREQRRLTRLGKLHTGTDLATGLPTGSMLLNEVEHAFWRSGRLNGNSTVVCLNLSNLYELGQVAGHGVEHQILVTMAARIRRAAGFRCVVGLYHPRCFVVVFASGGGDSYIPPVLHRLRSLLKRPLPVIGRDHKRYDFTPDIGMGVVTVKEPGRATPLEVINEAERLALGTETPQGPPDQVDTLW